MLLFESGHWLSLDSAHELVEANGLRFRTARHYLVCQQCVRAGDHAALDRVVRARTPAEVLRVELASAFREAELVPILELALLRKFAGNPELVPLLFATEDRVLVYACAADEVLGTGLAASDPDCLDAAKWPGANLLGRALASVRESLRRRVRANPLAAEPLPNG